MVCFARADGSKGSNKRQLEKPTPWVKMVAQLESKKRRKKSKDGAENGGNDGTPELTMKKVVKKTLKNVVKNTDTKNWTMQHPVKKSKKIKGMKTSKPQNTITPGGKCIKVFGTLSKKVKGTKKNNGAISLKKKSQKPLMMDNGSGSSQEKTSSVEKMDFDADSQGKDDMKVVVTTPATGKVKKNKKTNYTGNISKTNKGKLTNGVPLIASSKVNKKNKVKKNQLTTEMAPSLVAGEDNSREDEAESSKLVIRKTKEEIQTHDSNSQLKFEENELMTNYSGFWVLCEDVESLKAAKKRELEAIYAARTNMVASSQAELTEEEQLALDRVMKRQNIFHNRKLLGRVSKMGKKSDGGVKIYEKKYGRKGNTYKAVIFDGAWVKKEAADRLHNLREKLFKEGLSNGEVYKLIQRERRREEQLLWRKRKRWCLNCQQRGHDVSACLNLPRAKVEGQTSVCYTCGSPEHISSNCNLRKGAEKIFSFAICFVCRESGHISHQCPDNPWSVYPKGGACRGCGSVVHLAKNCPDLQGT